MIRLYGISRHNGSWGRVTAGIAGALESLDLLSGFVPLDDIDPQDEFPGATAPVGLLVGPPTLSSALVTHGMHEKRFAILAPNSSWLPEEAVQKLLPYAEPVAPSSWGADVLARYVGHRTEPYRHGVDERLFVHSAQARHERNLDPFFMVAHFASTHRERKGTRELVGAWKEMRMPVEKARLHIVIDAPPTYFGDDLGSSGISVRRPIDLPAQAMSLFYQRYHVIVQPSRGEGFGMTPLEALCCGVPVVATACTGHADYLDPAPPGAVIVSHGEDAPIDDGPGAVAPLVTTMAVREALSCVHQDYALLSEQAWSNAACMSRRWSWTEQTKDWLSRMGMY